jgi:hypothetical protein
MDKTRERDRHGERVSGALRVHLTVAAVAVLLIAGVAMAHDLFLYDPPLFDGPIECEVVAESVPRRVDAVVGSRAPTASGGCYPCEYEIIRLDRWVLGDLERRGDQVPCGDT